MGSEITAKEIEIPVENGYLAAKEWGLSTGEPVLALHGWQDNAATFDRLIPLLSPDLHIVAIDYIGHGRSSHKTDGLPYFKLEFIYHIKLIAEYFNWKKFSIIGHSWGSEFAITFSSMYPEMIDKVIGIDLLKPVTYSVEGISSKIKRKIDEYKAEQEKIKNNSNPPVYTKEEATKRLLNSEYNDCGEDEIKLLIERGTKEIEPGKYVFTRDPRIKYVWDCGFNSSVVMKSLISNIRCGLLLIKAKRSPIFSDQESYNEFLKLYSEKCSRFEYVEIDGNHFIHLSYPERIAPIINAFIKGDELENYKK
ncbi:serine hydrolase-like protein 2 [Centruroides sculpturatus]|uniref:serine hydrolase-like protein 2 n=1 Tax=Centruroides sculpturatus TaxID=218467 RepID=UPI000C6D9D8A|nr:serine hydrolase-like protein 2 [Centruroides sculpturatus]